MNDEGPQGRLGVKAARAGAIDQQEENLSEEISEQWCDAGDADAKERSYAGAEYAKHPIDLHATTGVAPAEIVQLLEGKGHREMKRSSIKESASLSSTSRNP